jgi:chromosome segregation ATPase
MSDSILPKIFEGFPELANQADSLEAALHTLSQQIEAHTANAQAADQGADFEALNERIASYELEQQELRSQVAALEEEKAALLSGQEQLPVAQTVDAAALQEEVAHWKEQYDALAGRFDAEIAAARSAAPVAGDSDGREDEIAALAQAKDAADLEITNLREALALARQEADTAKNELETLQQSAQEPTPAAPIEDDADLLEELESLQTAVDEAETIIQTLEAAKNEAENRAVEAQDARDAAAERLGALINSLSADQAIGAA